jgi:hypothetical protein
MHYTHQGKHPASRKWALTALVVASLAFLFLSQFAFAKTSQPMIPAQQQDRLPLDPLTREERDLAVRIVEDNAQARALRGKGRQKLVAVELIDVKPKNAESVTVEEPGRPIQTGRYAEVLYYRYDTGDGVRVVVDLRGRSVQEATRIDGNAVPLSFEEIEDAAKLALQDTQVRNLLGPSATQFRVVRPSSAEDQLHRDDGFRVEGLRILPASPNDPCWGRRCVSLLFRRGRFYLSGTQVTVDLTTQKVRVERTRR